MREPSPHSGRLVVVRLTEIPIGVRWAAACAVPDSKVKEAALSPTDTPYRVSASAYERVLGHASDPP